MDPNELEVCKHGVIGSLFKSLAIYRLDPIVNAIDADFIRPQPDHRAMLLVRLQDRVIFHTAETDPKHP